MKTSFLDYYKLILDKVSFDRQLMIKEYSKARATLAPHDQQQLDAWLRARGFSLRLPTSPPRRHEPDTRPVGAERKTQTAS